MLGDDDFLFGYLLDEDEEDEEEHEYAQNFRQQGVKNKPADADPSDQIVGCGFLALISAIMVFLFWFLS